MIILTSYYYFVRTPMNAVIALTDLLLQERSSLNIEQIEHLEVIQTSGSHLLTVSSIFILKHYLH